MIFNSLLKTYRSSRLISQIKKRDGIGALEYLKTLPPDSFNKSININLLDSSGSSALYYAVAIDYPDLALELLALGTNPNIIYTVDKTKNIKGTILHMCASQGMLALIYHFAANQPHLMTAADSTGLLPLDYAVETNNFEAIAAFINYFDNPSSVNELKAFPKTIERLAQYLLDCQDYEKFLFIFSFLEKHNILPIFDNGNNVLMQYAKNYTTTKFNIDSPEYEDIDLALSANSIRKAQAYKIFNLFIASPSIDINHQNEYGSTALMILVDVECFDLALLLLNANANCLLLNKNARTALSLLTMPRLSSDGRLPRMPREKKLFLETIPFVIEKQKIDKAISESSLTPEFSPTQSLVSQEATPSVFLKPVALPTKSNKI